MTSDTMDIEKAEFMLRGMDVILARETRGHRTAKAETPATEMPNTGHRGQMSAEPMSGSNPDEMDGEGTAFAKRRQLPRRKSQMASRIGCTFTMPVGESVSMIQSQLLGQGEQT